MDSSFSTPASLCENYPLLDKEHTGVSAGVAVFGKVYLGGAFRLEEGGYALHFGEAGFLNALILEPRMKDASAKRGVKFPKDLCREFILKGDG
jgi:hypothetical protein